MLRFLVKRSRARSGSEYRAVCVLIEPCSAPINRLRYRAAGRAICLHSLSRVPITVLFGILPDGWGIRFALGGTDRFWDQSALAAARHEGCPPHSPNVYGSAARQDPVFLLGIFLLGLLVVGGVWSVTTPLAMAIGVFLMTLQSLGDMCEAVGLLFHRYATVALFRLFMSLGMYAVPLVCGVLLGAGSLFGWDLYNASDCRSRWCGVVVALHLEGGRLIAWARE